MKEVQQFSRPPTRKVNRGLSEGSIAEDPQAPVIAEGQHINTLGSSGTIPMPLSVPSSDPVLDADQVVTIRVGQESMRLKNVDEELQIRVQGVWITVAEFGTCLGKEAGLIRRLLRTLTEIPPPNLIPA